MLAEAVAAVGHDSQRRVRQAGQQRNGLWHFVRLARREGEGDRAATPVGDHAGLTWGISPSRGRLSAHHASSGFQRPNDIQE